MGGLAFGMLASNPLFRVMGCFGYGCGCGYGGVAGFILGGGYNAVNLTGFANPFPSIFGGGYMGGGYASSAGLIMPTGMPEFWVITVGFLIANFGQYGLNLVMMVSIVNTVEYNEYKHGVRDEAII